MNMGAGRIVYQDLTRIDKSIRDGELFESPVLAEAMDRCVDGQHALHFIGLLSDGGVHSSQQHLHALVEMAARRRVPRVFIHAITDGRDTSPTGGVRYLVAAAGRPRSSRDRPCLDDLRALLRDGSRQALGADQACLRRDRQRDRGTDDAVADRGYSGLVRSRHHRRIHQTRRRRGCRPQPGRARPGRGLHRLLQFPRGSRTPADTRDRARRLRWLSPSRSPARPLHHDDGVRSDLQPADGVHASDVQRQPGGRSRRQSAARTCGWPKRRSTRTSPTSSTAGGSSRTRARIASSSRRRRSRRTTSSRR